MSKIRLVGKSSLVMALIAILAFGGLYGCASSGDSSDSDSSSSDPGAPCEGVKADTCESCCESTGAEGEEYLDCVEICLRDATP